MNKNRLSFYVLLALAVCNCNFGLADTKEWERVSKITADIDAHPWNFDPSALEPKTREAVLTDLRRYGLQLANPTSAAALLHIMDEEAVGRVRYISADAIIKSRQPRLVPYFVEDFLRQDGDSEIREFDGSETTTRYPKSIEIGQLVLALLEKCPEVTGDVRVWAHDNAPEWVAHKAGVAAFRNMMTNWWSANGEHFKAGRFDLIRPGVNLIPDVIQSQPATSSEPASSVAQSQPPVASTLRVNPNPNGESEPVTNSTAYFVIGSIALAAALIVLRIWLQKKRRS